MPKYKYYFWYEDTGSFSLNHPLQLKDITEENLSWLPLETVPITEYLPFNSLKQPALSPYVRIEWNGHFRCKDYDCLLRSFVQKHENEMGYVLVHKGNVMGIIGVTTERDGMCCPGFATVFNARETHWSDKKCTYPSLPVAMTTLKKRIKSIHFCPGEMAYDHRIPDPDWASCDDLAD